MNGLTTHTVLYSSAPHLAHRWLNLSYRRRERDGKRAAKSLLLPFNFILDVRLDSTGLEFPQEHLKCNV